jgi:hypothetical protein
MIDNYKKFTESVDDRDHYDDEYYGHNTDGMEHITYLLRTTLRNKGIDDFTGKICRHAITHAGM